MRIAYVSSCYLPHLGGVETHVSELASRVAAAGWEVDVLTPETDRSLPPTDVVDGVTVLRFGPGAGARRRIPAANLWLHLVRHGRRYDLVHAHNYHALPALAAAASCSRPLVFTPHYLGTGESPLLRFMHSIYRGVGAQIIRASSSVICVSHAEAHLVRGHFAEASSRITVIPNGVDVTGIRAADPYPIDRKVVLCAARLEDYKNVQLAVAALPHLDDGFVLKVAGDGPARGTLEQVATDLGVRERVDFLGHLDHATLARWFRTASVFVTMSARECFGITLLEALTGGARAVAAEIPAHREVAARAHGGDVTFVDPAASPAMLAQAIAELAARPRTAGASAPTWDAVAEETLAVYRAVLAREASTVRAAS